MTIDLPDPPRVIECNTCHLPVPIVDALCPHCGTLVPESAFEELRSGQGT